MTRVLVAALLVLYPVLMWLALQQASPRIVASLIVAGVAVATLLAMTRTHALLPILLRRFGVLVVLALVAAAFDDPLALKLLPVLTHLWLLYTFGSTLVRGPSLVEQFAAASHGGAFPDFLQPYARIVTAIWCVFFAANAAIYAYLAAAAPIGTWAFYTGFGCYVLTFALAAAEYVFHKVAFRFYEDGWADRIWRRLLPPERTAFGRRILAWQEERGRGGAA